MLSQQQINSGKNLPVRLVRYVSAEFTVLQGLQFGILAGHASLQV